MITLLRKHRHWLMIVIAILALPFCIYFVKTDYSAIRPDDFARIYGRNISLVEARRDARLFDLARALGMSSFRQDLSAGAQSEAEAYVPFILNLVILRHEAARLGIQPTASEIADVVRNLEAFRGSSGFDLQKYNDFTQNFLAPNGLGEEQIEQLVRDELCLNRIKQLVAAGPSPPESESKANYDEAYGQLFVSVIRLRSPDFAKDIKVTDDDVRKYYEAHKAEFKSEERRKVEFVSLALSDEQKKLSGKERIDALQKLADRANDFAQALLEKGADFHQVATKFQLPVESTGEFTGSAPDPKLKADPQLNQAAFKLTPQEPNSDPLQSADGFAILHLAGVIEARPLTLDEAKQKIVDQIKNERGREMAVAKGRKAVETLRNGLKAGQPLQFTLEQAGGLKAEKLEPFTVADEADAKNSPEKPKDQPADLMMIKNVAAQLQPGEVSDFVPWIDGGLIVLMDKREQPDPAKYQQTKATFEERYLKNARDYVFAEWLYDRQRAAGLRPTKG